MAVPFTFLSNTPHVPVRGERHVIYITDDPPPCVWPPRLTCSSDELSTAPGCQLQAVYQGADRQRSERVGVPLLCGHWTMRAGRYSHVTRSEPLPPQIIPAMRPMCPDDVIRSPAFMFSVAIIQRFRFPPATSAMSADLQRGRGGQIRSCGPLTYR